VQKCNQVLDFASQQLRHLVETYPDYFPMYTRNGKWKHGGEAWTNWCEGFLGGQLWLLHEHTGEKYWREKAEHYSRLIEHRKTDRNVHDLGFLFWSTYKRWYDLTGDPAIKQVVIDARLAFQRERAVPLLVHCRRKFVH
jgi:unsaturated chondroitin disaccharide hydrolase